ncbi:MAG TPA: FkbM family methyltransferase [Solirubrobacteraceae bacterium]|jgi:FkbM family methyltransferase|nr:FkbM family methyltransferase [Solirubrobacteraceae bacterium]
MRDGKQRSQLRVALGAARLEYRRRRRHRLQPASAEVGGVKLDLSDSWATPAIREAIYDCYYEFGERCILEHTLRPDDRYLELGGGIGVVATYACRIVGAENVTVYEGNPALIDAIRGTAKLNGFQPTVINAVLGDTDGESDFYVTPNFWASGLTAKTGARAIRVPMQSFGDALRRLTPTYLMADIEGAEVELLARQLPRTLRAICMEVHPRVVGDVALQQLLIKLLTDGFILDVEQSMYPVLFLRRPG